MDAERPRHNVSSVSQSFTCGPAAMCASHSRGHGEPRPLCLPLAVREVVDWLSIGGTKPFKGSFIQAVAFADTSPENYAVAQSRAEGRKNCFT